MSIAILENGESRTLEFKSELPKGKQLAQTVVAFANGAGGELLIGVSDDCKAIGIGNTDRFEMADRIAAMIYDNCSPQIAFDTFVREINGQPVMVVKVYPGRLKPYYLKSMGRDAGVFIRIGASNRIADATVIQELERQRSNISFDEEIEYHATPVDPAFLFDAFKQLGLALSEDKMCNLGLLKQDGGTLKQTRGLHILAGAYPHVMIQCARFKGTDMAVFLDKKEFTGNLFEQLRLTELFIQNHLRVTSTFSGLQRRDRLEIPLPAIREALVNAVVHRDYSNDGRTIKVAIYDDIFEIVSPGCLPNTLTLEQLKQGGRSEIRNKVVASIFKRLNYIEQWGSGIERMNTLCREAEIALPEVSESGDFVSVTFPRPILSTESVDKTVDKTVDNADMSVSNTEKILAFIREHGAISNRQARQITALSATGVRYLLQKLSREGRIVSAGGNRNRTYSLLSK